MKTVQITAATCLMLSLGASLPAVSQTEALKTCQALKDRIEHYTRLRRGGGSVGQMEGWKMQRRKSEEKFQRYECRRHGRKLR